MAVADQQWRVVERHRLTRAQLRRFFAEHQPCPGWSWKPAARPTTGAAGSRPGASRSPCCRPSTSALTSAALLEAARCFDLPSVPVKTEHQQALAALHRLRSGWMATRGARLNALRGLLREFGVTIPRGARFVLPRVHELLEDADSPLPMALRTALWEACLEIRELEARIAQLKATLEALAREIPLVASLRSIPGIGLLTSTALLAMVGDIRRFPSGRHLASWLGLVPKERSSGSTRRLGRISKRVDPYLRMLLIHGARAVLRAAKTRKHPDRLRAWGLQVEHLRGHNKAAVALANKLARIAWALWRHGREFESQPQQQAT